MNQLLPVSYQPVDPDSSADTSADTAQPQDVVVKVEQEAESCGDEPCSDMPLMAGISTEGTCPVEETSGGVVQTKGSGDGTNAEESRSEEEVPAVGGAYCDGAGAEDVGGVSTEGAEAQVSGVNTEREGAEDVGGVNAEGSRSLDVGGEGAGAEDVGGARKRTLRNSTLVQKNAVYCLSRRNKKQKQASSPSSQLAASIGTSSVATEEGTTPPSLPAREGTGSPFRREPSDPAIDNTSDSVPNSLIQSQSNVNSTPLSRSQPTLLSHSHVTATPPSHSHVVPALPSHSHVTPEVAVGSSGSNATSQSEHAEMMEIVSMTDEEFGVSEVPVFAVEPDRSRQPMASLPQSSTPLSTITLPHPTSTPSQQPPPSSVHSQQPHPSSVHSQQPHAPSQPHPSSSSAHSQSPSSFSSSTQSAFKPVTTSNSSNRIASPSKPSSKAEPSNGTSSSSFSQLGMKAVTLGEFSEAFIQGDTTNWFRRMKLLDHIETVQDNVQAWLEMIEQSLDGKSAC